MKHFCDFTHAFIGVEQTVFCMFQLESLDHFLRCFRVKFFPVPEKTAYAEAISPGKGRNIRRFQIMRHQIERYVLHFGKDLIVADSGLK